MLLLYSTYTPTSKPPDYLEPERCFFISPLDNLLPVRYCQNMRYDRSWSGRGTAIIEVGRDSGEDDIVGVRLVVSGTAYYEAGRTWAAPEDCWPSDCGVEVESVIDEEGKDWSGRLTDDEWERAEEALIASIKQRSGECCEPEDQYVYDY